MTFGNDVLIVIAIYLAVMAITTALIAYFYRDY
jgi:hypothetical protein